MEAVFRHPALLPEEKCVNSFTCIFKSDIPVKLVFCKVTRGNLQSEPKELTQCCISDVAGKAGLGNPGRFIVKDVASRVCVQGFNRLLNIKLSSVTTLIGD